MPYVPLVKSKVNVDAHLVHLGTPAVSAQAMQLALAGQATQTLSPRLY